jgi:hypothetical protein
MYVFVRLTNALSLSFEGFDSIERVVELPARVSLRRLDSCPTLRNKHINEKKEQEQSQQRTNDTKRKQQQQSSARGFEPGADSLT